MTTKKTAKKTATPSKAKASTADQAKINRERQRQFRLRHDRPMSINPKMAAERMQIVLATWQSPTLKKMLAVLTAAARAAK